MLPAALLQSSPVACLPVGMVSLTCTPDNNSFRQINTLRHSWPLCILRDLCDLIMVATLSGHQAHKPAYRTGSETQRTRRKYGDVKILELQYLNILTAKYQIPTHHSLLTLHLS